MPPLPTTSSKVCSADEITVAENLNGTTTTEKLLSLSKLPDLSQSCRGELGAKLVLEAYKKFPHAERLSQFIRNAIENREALFGTIVHEEKGESPAVVLEATKDHPRIWFSTTALTDGVDAGYKTEINAINMQLDPESKGLSTDDHVDCDLDHELLHWKGGSELEASRFSARCDPDMKTHFENLGNGNIDRGIFVGGILLSTEASYISAALDLDGGEMTSRVASMLPGGKEYEKLINDIYNNRTEESVNSRTRWEGKSLQDPHIREAVRAAVAMKLTPGAASPGADDAKKIETRVSELIAQALKYQHDQSK